jgi:hypothetical protein
LPTFALEIVKDNEGRKDAIQERVLLQIVDLARLLASSAKRLNKTHPKPVEDAKYLTLLSSSGMLQLVISEARPPEPAGNFSIQPPKLTNEKDLYGC